MILGAENVLDLAVGLGVVRTVLHQVEFVGAHRERLQRTVVAGSGNEDFRFVTGCDEARFGPGRHIDPFGFSIPDIYRAVADGLERLAFDLYVDGPCGRDDASLVTGYRIFEGLAFPKFDDVEVIERYARVIDIDDRFVAVVKRRYVHDQPSLLRWSMNGFR